MPLHGDEIAVVAALKCFDKTIRRFRGGDQSVTQLANPLMMQDHSRPTMRPTLCMGPLVNYGT